MNLHDETTERAVEAIMDDERQVRRVPDVVRVRLLARARSHVQATAGAVLVPSPVVLPASPWWSRRWAFAVAALLAFSAAGAAAALHGRGVRSPEVGPTPQARPTPALHLSSAPLPAAVPPPVVAQPIPSVTAERPRRALSPQESYAAELSLLQRAHSEYNARAFRGALALLAEHARRFPNGRLAEEREALHVRSLEADGRENEASRTLAAFGRRFPHSALLPRLRESHSAESVRDP